MRRALSLTYNASLFVYYKRLIYRPLAITYISIAILIQHQQCTNGASINEFENKFFLKHSLELKLHASMACFGFYPHYTLHYRQLLFEMRQFNFKDSVRLLNRRLIIQAIIRVIIQSQILPRNLFEIFFPPKCSVKICSFYNCLCSLYILRCRNEQPMIKM